MESFVKGFLGVFLVAMIAYLSMGIISAEVDSSQARNYMDNVKKAVAESDFSRTVINEAGNKAVQDGYEMEVTVYERGIGKRSTRYSASENGDIGNTKDVTCVNITMTYPYSVPILGVKNQHTVRGYVN